MKFPSVEFWKENKRGIQCTLALTFLYGLLVLKWPWLAGVPVMLMTGVR